jgi:hypothetical protein
MLTALWTADKNLRVHVCYAATHRCNLQYDLYEEVFCSLLNLQNACIGAISSSPSLFL